MKHTNIDYLQDILINAERAESFVAGIEYSAFPDNYEKVYAVVHALQTIGEAARHLPKSLLKQYPEIPWDDIIGMRDIVIHEYFGVNLKTVWRTVHEDLPLLKETARTMLDDLSEKE